MWHKAENIGAPSEDRKGCFLCFLFLEYLQSKLRINISDFFISSLTRKELKTLIQAMLTVKQGVTDCFVSGNLCVISLPSLPTPTPQMAECDRIVKSVYTHQIDWILCYITWCNEMVLSVEQILNHKVSINFCLSNDQKFNISMQNLCTYRFWSEDCIEG